MPHDDTEHGGGFVFDCRCLPNPGREERFFRKTGQDKEVVEFLEKCPKVEKFFQASLSLIQQAVSNYQEREFNHLMIAFGCTGGQHRSVYMAERVAKVLRNQEINVIVCHRECERWPK